MLKACMDSGYQCSVLGKTAPDGSANIDGVQYFQADIRNREEVISTLIGHHFDYVVNLSGYINHASIFNGGNGVIETHFTGLVNLLSALDVSGLKRFVQIGSSDEYGLQPAPQSEDMREMPIGPYSVAKVAATHLMQMLHRTQGFPVIILRLFLVYGEGQDNGRFLPQVINGCLEARQFAVSEGSQLRDFCHVDDICRGIMTSLTADAEGEVINLASGTPVSLRAVIETVRRLIGKGEPDFDQIKIRPSENMALYAEVEKANRLLGWNSRIGLNDGLKRTITFYAGEKMNYKSTSHNRRI